MTKQAESDGKKKGTLIKPEGGRDPQEQHVSQRHGAAVNESVEERGKRSRTLIRQRAAVRPVRVAGAPTAADISTESHFVADFSRVPTHTAAPSTQPASGELVTVGSGVDRHAGVAIQRRATVVDRRPDGAPHTIRFQFPTPETHLGVRVRIDQDLRLALHHRVAAEISEAIRADHDFTDALREWFGTVQNSETLVFTIRYVRGEPQGSVEFVGGEGRGQRRTETTEEAPGGPEGEERPGEREREERPERPAGGEGAAASEGEVVRRRVFRDMFVHEWDPFLREIQREVSLIVQSRTEGPSGEPVRREIELTENNSSLRRAFEDARRADRPPPGAGEDYAPSADIIAEFHYVGGRCEYIVFRADVPPPPPPPGTRLDGRFRLEIVSEEEQDYHIVFEVATPDRTADQLLADLFTSSDVGWGLQNDGIIGIDRSREHPSVVVFMPAMPAEDEVEIQLEAMMNRPPNPRIRNGLRGRWRAAFDTVLRELYERFLHRRYPNTPENRQEVLQYIGINCTADGTFARWFCANQSRLLDYLNPPAHDPDTGRRAPGVGSHAFREPGPGEWSELVRHRQAGSDANGAAYFVEQRRRLQEVLSLWHHHYDGANQGELAWLFLDYWECRRFRSVMRLTGPGTIGPPGITVPRCMQDPRTSDGRQILRYREASIRQPPADPNLPALDGPECSREGGG